MRRKDCAEGRETEVCLSMKQGLRAQISLLNTIPDIQWMDGILRKADEPRIFWCGSLSLVFGVFAATFCSSDVKTNQWDMLEVCIVIISISITNR